MSRKMKQAFQTAAAAGIIGGSVLAGTLGVATWFAPAESEIAEAKTELETRYALKDVAIDGHLKVFFNGNCRSGGHDFKAVDADGAQVTGALCSTGKKPAIVFNR